MMMLPNHSCSRFLWKEYRTQRSSWLALLIGAGLLQVLFLFFDDPTQRSLAVYPYAVGAVLTACYAIACGAILFAGEREEETDRLLQVFPFPMWKLTAGKLLYAAISILLFAGLSLWGGYLVASIAGPQFTRFDWNSNVNNAAGLSLLNYFLSGILGFAAAVLCSILTGRVMFALIGGATGMTLLTAISHNYLPGIKNSMDLAVSVLLIGVSVLLVPGWLNNRLQFPTWRRRKTPEDVSSSGWSACWLRCLQWLSQRATPVRRMSGVLLWKELRSAVPVYAVLFLLTALGGLWPAMHCFLAWAGVGDRSEDLLSEQILAALIMASSVLAMVMAAVASILSFSGDQTRLRMQFLADRGVAPIAIWGMKQIVWLLPILLSLTLSGTMLASLLRESLAGDRQVESEVVARVVSDIVMMYSVVVFGTLCTFALAQLLSMWIRRTILAVCLGCLSGYVIWLGLYSQYELGIPFWMTAGVFTGTCLAASLFTLEGWLKQTRTWNWRAVQLAWIVVPGLLITVTVREWRAFEIPPVNPGFDWQAHERRMAAFDSNWSRQWEQLESLAVDGRNSDDEFLQQAVQAADQILASPELQLASRQRFENSPAVSQLTHWLNTEKGHGTSVLNQEWRILQAACVLNRYQASQTLLHSEQERCRFYDRQLHRRLRLWIQDADQTPELLTRYIESSFGAVNRADRIQNRYVLLRQIFEQRGWAWDWLQKQNRALSSWNNRCLFGLLGGSENQRSIRLLNHQARFAMKQETFTEPELFSLEAQLRKWQRTTPWMESYVQEIVNGQGSFIVNEQGPFAEWIASQPEGIGLHLLARLERYRLEHGAYPDSLEIILESAPEQIQLAAASYAYHPQGYSLPLVVSEHQVLPAGQPLLIRRRGWWDFTVTPAIPPYVLLIQDAFAQSGGKQGGLGVDFSDFLWRYQGGLPTIHDQRMLQNLLNALQKIPEPASRVLLLNDTDDLP
jgi:hypothetical protein